VVLDSHSELVSSNVLVVREGSSTRHSGSQLESSSIWKWLSSPVDVGLIDEPGLVKSVVAVIEDNMSVVGVRVSVNVQALLTKVSDVSSGSGVPLDLHGVITSPWSDGGGNTNSESITLLVGNGVASSVPGSDRVGSSIEGPPLVPVSWVVVSDSKSELAGSDVLMPEEGSVVSHSGSDLESDT